jgi:geranylgeranyl pyrophosphate synthase
VQTRLDAALDDALGPADGASERLVAAMRHLLFPGGKRLRPALALAGAEAVGGDADAAMPVAIAVELVHAYSLIHDDLPCMDDDDERRGRPTVHVAFDEATAVLAGDALLTLAFEVLARDARTADASRRVATVADLAHAAGAVGLVGGQVDDLAPTSPTQQWVEHVHARKSAALLAASITGGARLAGASDEVLVRLQRAGIAAGIAFQNTDDLLDADEDDVCSLLRVMGPEKARQRAETLLEEALGECAGRGAPPAPPGAQLPTSGERARGRGGRGATQPTRAPAPPPTPPPPPPP